MYKDLKRVRKFTKEVPFHCLQAKKCLDYLNAELKVFDELSGAIAALKLQSDYTFRELYDLSEIVPTLRVDF